MSTLLKYTFVVLMVATIEASAQTSAIPWSALSSGGMISSSSATRVRTVIGQSALGQTRSSTTLITGGFLARSVGGVTAVDQDAPPMPAVFALMQNYPNPFNPSTTIGYSIPDRSAVTLTVFNAIGQQVAQPVNAEMASGYHEARFDGSGLASGVYFYRIQVRPSESAPGSEARSGAGTYVETKKLLLLR
jgi:hypothetical protein